MSGWPLNLIGMAVLALWLWRQPRLPFWALWVVWLAGLLLMRLAPGPILGWLLHDRSIDEAPGLAGAFRLICLLGTFLVLRALIGFARWDRRWTRWGFVRAIAFGLAVLLEGFEPRLSGLWAALALPFVWSFRWRFQLGAGRLTLAWFTALVSLVLSQVGFGGAAFTRTTSAVAAHDLVGHLVLIYSLVALPLTASRAHLSIRRIGPRLVGSHLLAGVVPFILTTVFLLLSGALFLSTYRGSIAARTLTGISEAGRSRLARALATGENLPPSPFGDDLPGQLVLFREDAGPARTLAGAAPFNPDSLLACDEPSSKTPLLWDNRTLFLRARCDTVVAGRNVRVEALAPVDSATMAKLCRMIGSPVRAKPHLRVVHTSAGISIGPTAGLDTDATRPPSSLAPGLGAGATRPPSSLAPGLGAGATTPPSSPAAGLDTGAGSTPTARAKVPDAIGPPDTGHALRIPGGAIIGCLRRDAGPWTASAMPLSASTALGEQIVSLFRIGRENPLATVALVALALVAVLLIGAAWVTSSMVVQMGRSITRAVRALTEATGALRRGDLRHRITLEADDELWRVAASFNEMADGLEKMRSMELEAERLEEELRLARAIQDRLLPAAPPELEGVELAGISLPAREVGGDYFDYLVLEGGPVGLAIADVSGKGAPAALLMSTFRASLRSQDLAALGPAEVLGRVNRFIHSSVDPGKFITAFLGLLDPATGRFRYANAGHDPPLVLRSDGTLSELTGGGLILGLLPQIVYEEACTTLDRGSLLTIFTDGVTEARNPEGDFFGSERIGETLTRVRGRSCVQVLQDIVAAIQDFSASGPQADDITLVLARRR